MIAIPPKHLENSFANDVITVVTPSQESLMIRAQTFEYIKNFVEKLVATTMPGMYCCIYFYGSAPLGTSLSDSDIDISILVSDTANKTFLPAFASPLHLLYSFPIIVL